MVLVVAAYWWAAPLMGWPTVSDLFYVFGPDFEGQRIEEVMEPSNLAKQATGKVVDGVVDEVAERSGWSTQAPASPARPPEPVPVQTESRPLPQPMVESESPRAVDQD